MHHTSDKLKKSVRVSHQAVPGLILGVTKISQKNSILQRFIDSGTAKREREREWTVQKS